MSTRVDCPNCGHRLVVSPRATGPSLTCPECLARVPNPNVQAAPPLREAVLPAAGPAGAETCPSCGEPVNAGWRFCPLCNARLVAPPPARSGSDVAFAERAVPLDEEVRWDTTGMGVGLIILAVIALAGALLMFTIGERATAGLLVLVLLACAVLFLAVGRRRVTGPPRAEPDREAEPPDRPEAARPREHRPPVVVEERRTRDRGGDVAGAAVGGAAAGGAGGLLAGCALGVGATLLVVGLILLAVISAIVSSINTCFQACGYK